MIHDNTAEKHSRNWSNVLIVFCMLIGLWIIISGYLLEPVLYRHKWLIWVPAAIWALLEIVYAIIQNSGIWKQQAECKDSVFQRIGGFVLDNLGLFIIILFIGLLLALTGSTDKRIGGYIGAGIGFVTFDAGRLVKKRESTGS